MSGNKRRARESAPQQQCSTTQRNREQPTASAPTPIYFRARPRRVQPLLLSSSSCDGGGGKASTAQDGTGSQSAAPPPSNTVVATGAAMDSMELDSWDDFHEYLNSYMATSFQVWQSMGMRACLLLFAYSCVFVAGSFAIDGVCGQAKQNYRRNLFERVADSGVVTVLPKILRMHAGWRVQIPREGKARSPRHTSNGMWSEGLRLIVVGEFVCHTVTLRRVFA